MTVTRSTGEEAKEGPATLTIFFNEPSAATTTPTTTPVEALAADSPGRTEVIDMKYKHESEILKQVMDLTKATQVRATPEEQAEIQALGEQKRRSTQDMVRNAKLNDQIRQEKELLKQARAMA